MTHNPTPILCRECGDCFVDRLGDTCGECLAWAAERDAATWDPRGDAYDRARDRDEEDRCHE
jgi:hypothetical protein